MKSLPMIVGMILAAAMAPVWAAEKAQPAESGANPPTTVAWGPATNELQAGLVPLGGVKGWDRFLCPDHTNGISNSSMLDETAVRKRCCRICATPKPWSATFVEGDPLRMELHFRNLAKVAHSLYDASYGETWHFTFTPVGGGTSWQAGWALEARRSADSFAQSTIKLGAGDQNEAAVEMELGSGWMFIDPQGRQPATNHLSAGKYTVTASYAHPEHAWRKPCDYWHGMVTTSPVEIEIKPDDAAARFLDAAKYAGFAAVAVVKKLPQGGDKTKPAQLGIEWWDRLYAPEIARNELSDVRALSLEDGPTAANLQLGDRILVTVDQQQVMILALSKRLDKSSLNGAKWISWSQSRQDALDAALAPGWREGCCPWCRRGARPDYPVCACRDGCVGEGCTQNRRNRGECMTCERKVSPATPGVTFRLWAFDPKAERELTPRNECRILVGAGSLPLWVEVQNEKGSTPEFQTPGGGAQFSACQTLFYLVEGPGLSGPTPAFHVDAGALRRMEVPSALRQGVATGQVHLVANKLFAAPGTYSVCAVAGRLVSNPIKIIVEPDTAAQGKSKQEAETKAQIEAMGDATNQWIAVSGEDHAYGQCNAVEKVRRGWLIEVGPPRPKPGAERPLPTYLFQEGTDRTRGGAHFILDPETNAVFGRLKQGDIEIKGKALPMAKASGGAKERLLVGGIRRLSPEPETAFSGSSRADLNPAEIEPLVEINFRHGSNEAYT